MLVDQLPDYSFALSQADYCLQLKQIDIEDQPAITDGERAQARALLGAVQWRVQQTAPQHAAKLSWLQSALPQGGKDVLRGVNKLCREVFAQREVSVSVQNLEPQSLHELVMVAWTDAAVGNRPDLSSTGGYIVGLVNPNLSCWVKGRP